MAQSVFMKKLRDSMKIIFFIVALLFVGMMVFQWGMNITGKSRAKVENVIGEVGEEDKIDYQQYSREYQAELQNLYDRGQSVDDFAASDIREQAWHAVVNRAILKHQFEKKLAATATGKEIYQALKRNPPDWLRQQPQFLDSTGNFDYQKYLQFLNNPDVDWAPVERAVAANLPYQKLQELISTMTFVTMPEAMDQYIFENTKARGEFLLFDSDTYHIQVDTSEAALRKYYETHKDSLVEKPYIVYKYIQIPYLASSQDSAEVKTDVDTVYAKLKSGEETFEDMAEAYSQDLASARNGGDIGWYGRGQLIPEFEEVATKLDSGQISEPVLSRFGWHIIKCLGKKVVTDSTGKTDTLWHLAHILFKIEPGYETSDSLDKLAEEIREYTKEHGIDEAAKKFGLEVVTTPEVGYDEAIPGVGLRTLVNQFAIKHGPGAVPEVVKSNGAYFVMQVVEVVPPKFNSFEEAREFIKKKLIKQALRKKRRELAELALEKIRSGESFQQVARELGATYDTTGWVGAFDPIPGYGYRPWINGALLGLPAPGAVSPPLEGSDGEFYIVKLLERKDADMSKFAEQQNQLRQNIFQAKKQNAYDQWFANLRRQIPIKDFRLKYLYGEEGTPADTSQ